MVNYIEIIADNYPSVNASIVGDPSIYENIRWGSPESQIPKAELDALIPSSQKAYMWERIKEYRETRKFNGIFVADKWFHTDNDSRVQWLGLKDRAKDILATGGTLETVLTIKFPENETEQPIVWNTMDNSGIMVTVQLAIDVVNAIGYNDINCHKIGLVHKYHLYNSATPLEYDYKVNWPAVFGE